MAFSKFNNMKSLADDILSRHGIKRQVTSAMIVERTQRFLEDHMPEIAKREVRAISLNERQLKIGATNAAARYKAAELDEQLIEHLKTQFPDLEIEKIIHVIDPSIKDRLIQ